MANCVNCTDIGADSAINGNRYLCKNCKPKKEKDFFDSHFEVLTITKADVEKVTNLIKKNNANKKPYSNI